MLEYQKEIISSYINHNPCDNLIKKIIIRDGLCHLDCTASLELLFVIIK